MKNYAVAIAAAGLLSLGACHSRTPEGANVENQGDMVADNLNNAADNLSAAADNMGNSSAADSLQNASDNLHQAAGNVTDDAAAQADNVDAAVKGKK